MVCIAKYLLVRHRLIYTFSFVEVEARQQMKETPERGGPLRLLPMIGEG